VSECLFPNQSIFVQGLDWCLDKSKEIRIESLTAKILCKDHNAALSELDAVAGRAFDSIRDYVAATTNRCEMPYVNWAPKQFTIDGPRLERWCLKTLLNFSFSRQLVIGPGSHGTGTVPSSLVRIAFGFEEFTNGRGLYTAFRQNETFNLQYHFGYTAKTQGANLTMGSFHLCGFRFYLNLMPVANRYTEIEDSQVFYRQTHFAHKPVSGNPVDTTDIISSIVRDSRLKGRFSHRLSISWPLLSPR